MPKRVDDEFQPVRNLQLGKHRAQMVSYGRLTYIETLADELVLESFGNKCDHLSLTRCQACDLSRFTIRSLLAFTSYVVQNTAHHRTINPYLSSVNFSDCLQ